MTKYYRYQDTYSSIKFFKVKDQYSDVVQVIHTHTPKVGRSYCVGITLIKYTSFIGNYGWKLAESKNCIEITKNDFTKAFMETAQKLHN